MPSKAAPSRPAARQVRLSHEVKPPRSERLLFGLLVDVELEFYLFLPEVSLETRVLKFTLQGVDVGVRQRVRRQFVLDDVLRRMPMNWASGVARYSERCALLMEP